MADMRLVVTGAGGRMGRMLIRAVHETEGAVLSGALERPGSPLLGQDAGTLAGVGALGIPVTAAGDPCAFPVPCLLPPVRCYPRARSLRGVVAGRFRAGASEVSWPPTLLPLRTPASARACVRLYYLTLLPCSVRACLYMGSFSAPNPLPSSPPLRSSPSRLVCAPDTLLRTQLVLSSNGAPSLLLLRLPRSRVPNANPSRSLL